MFETSKMEIEEEGCRRSQIVLKEDQLSRIDVPGDGSCLFWAVAVPYLIQVKNNPHLFIQRFERLFGAKEFSKSQYVQHLLSSFDLSENNALKYENVELVRLVTREFRRRLVEHMSQHEEQLCESVSIDDFKEMKNETFITDGTFKQKFEETFALESEGANIVLNNLQPRELNEETVKEIDNELDKLIGGRSEKLIDLQKFKFRMYSESMKSSSSWGGNHEIEAMKSMLGCEILVHSENQLVSAEENSVVICLFLNHKIHYQFGLIKAQFLIEFIDRNFEDESLAHLNIGVDKINYQNSDKWSLLHFAAKNDHSKLVHSLINQGANVNLTNSSAQTPLDVAVLHNSRSFIKSLNIYVKQNPSNSSLASELSAADERIEKAMESVPEAHPSLKFNRNGKNALHVAAEEGNAAILETILSWLRELDETVSLDNVLNAPINGNRKQTALHLATRNNRVKVVEILLENKAKVNVKDVNSEGYANWTPLHYAAEKGHLLVVKLLVEKGGALVDVLDRTKGTPLQRAVRFGEFSVVEYLVEVGADVNSRDQTSISVLSYAAKAGCLRIVQFLVEHKADVNAADKNGITVLLHAAKSGKWDVVRYLVEMGADPNVESNKYVTPLGRAIKTKQWEMANFLIQNGASISDLSENQMDSLRRKFEINIVKEDQIYKLLAKFTSDGRLVTNGDSILNVLPRIYEEFQTLNLPISQNVSLFIESQLIKDRLLSERNADEIDAKIEENDGGNIKLRISLVIDGIEKLREISLRDGNEISDAFLFVGKFAAQNMQILKERVRDQLPWIEMQFCLIQFVYSHLEPRKADVIGKLVLNKARLMKHLLNFKSQLEKLENPNFESLKEDYEVLRDLYSLNRIESYVNLACSVDLNNGDVLVGQQVIFRALQVTGECLKTSNMSDKVNHLLTTLAPKNVLKIMKDLRDSLSHVEHLHKKNEADDRAFLLGVQNDLIKLKDEITFVLFLKKNEALKIFFRRVYECKNVDEAKEIISGIQSDESLKIELSDKQNDVFNKVADLIEKLKKEVKITKEVQRDLFQELENAVDKHRLRLVRVKQQHADTIEAVNWLVYLISKNGDVNIIKNRAKSEIDKLNFRTKTNENVFEIMMEKIVVIHDSLEDPGLNVNNLYCDIFQIIEFEAKRVESIGKFRTDMSKEIDSDEIETVIEITNNVLQSISIEISNNEIRGQFLSEIENKTEIFRSKNTLIDFYSKIIAIYNSVIGFYDHFVDVYNDVIGFLKVLFDFYDKKTTSEGNKFFKLIEEDDFGRLFSELKFNKLVDENAFKITLEKVKNGELKENNVEEIFGEIDFCKLIDGVLRHKLIDKNKFAELLRTFRKSEFNSIDKSKKIKDEVKVANLIDDSEAKKLVDKVKLNLSIDEEKFSALIAKTLAKNAEKLFKDFSFKTCNNTLNSLQRIADSMGKLLKEVAKDSDIDNLVKLIKEFLKSLTVKFDEKATNEAFEKIKNEQRNQLKTYFFEKLEILRKIFPIEKSDLQLLALLRTENLKKIAVEMLVLNLTEVLNKLSLFESNKLFLDEFSPVLVGKNLRNYLAHGDPLISIIPTNYEVSLINHFHLFEREFRSEDDFYPLKQLIGKVTRENVPELEERYQQNLEMLAKKDDLFNKAKVMKIQDLINELINKEDLKVCKANGDTLLHFAARANNLDAFQHLLNEGLNLFLKNMYGHNALHAAVTSGSDEIIEHLLEKGFDPSFIVENGENLLDLAVQHGQLRIVTLLLANGADIEAVNNEGVTPIFDAVVNKHENIVIELLKAGSDVGARDKLGRTLAHLAVSNVGILKALLDKNADVNALDHAHNTPLHFACKEGEEESVVTLLDKKADVFIRNKDGGTLLHFAAQEGHAKIVETLLNENVDVDAVTFKMVTALHLACFRGHLEVVKVLLKRGTDVNVRNGEDMTALHIATMMGHSEIVDELLSNGAEIDCSHKSRVTPLLMAAELGYTEVFKLLVEKGANMRLKGIDGLTVLHLSAILENVELMEFILKKDNALINVTDDKTRTALHLCALTNKIKSAKFLIEKNAQLDVRDFEGMTPLHLSALRGHADVFEVLTRNGADVNAKDAKGWTALHSAAQNNNKVIVETLVKRKIDVNVRCADNCAALHLASQNGHLEMVKLLISNGSNVNLTGLNGWSSLHFASLSGHFEIVRHLLENGAKNDFSNSNASTPLHLAAQHGHFRVLKLLLDNNNGYVNSLARNKATALHLAAENGDASCIKLLIDNGADASVTFRENWTALHLAAMKGHVEAVEALLDKGSAVDAKLENETTPLHLAAQSNFVEVVEALRSKNADVNATYLNKMTALRNCSALGHEETVRCLLKHGAKVDERDGNEKSALHCAAEKGHFEIVKMLVENGSDVNLSDVIGWTALHWASEKGHLGLIEYLLTNKADPNLQTKTGSSALHLASKMGFSNIVDAILCHAETNVNVVDENLQSPLHLSAESGYVTIVQVLLNKNANVNAVNIELATPLHLASFGGHFETVRTLLNAGATVDFPNKDELTPLHVAALYRHSKVTLELLKFGADVNSKSSTRSTPLHMATEKNDVITVGHLLSRENVDVNAKKLDGVTPLHLASYLGFLNVTKLLIEAGAQVDSKTKQNYTPLHLATQSKHCDVIKLLAEHKANVNATFDGVTTALQLAVQFGLANVVETLLENGADVEDRAVFLAAKSGFPGVFKTLVRRKNGRGGSALIRAVKCKNVTLLKMILEEVNDWSFDEVNSVVNCVDWEGKNALICAAESGFLLAVDELLNCKGVNVNEQTTDGMTALHLSALNCYEEIVERLISKEADANLKDVEGRTAYDLVNEKMSSDAEKYEPIVALLLSVTI